MICLLPGVEAAEAFGAEVYARLPALPNDRDIFGPQIFMDAEDRPVGEEERMLAGATTIGVYECAALAERFGGVAYPAHIDRPSFSLLSNLGLWDPGLGFSLAELSRNCPADFGQGRRDLAGVPFLRGCDAHYVEQIADAFQSVELPVCTPEAAIDRLKKGKISCIS